MEPKHKELLAQCQRSLAQAMTEVEQVIALLEAAAVLGPRDLHQLREAGLGPAAAGEGGEGGGGSSEPIRASVAKAELLLQLLLAKERDHFQDLRVALEKTQPHLLSILYLNTQEVQPGESAEEEFLLCDNYFFFA
ncbi:hypothetical protein E2320_008224 [Naja naja]|nr:hypothetical protein E2320_008224 [Naja naja]